MVWDDPIFKRLFESHIVEAQGNLALRAQTEHQKVLAHLARRDMLSTGVGLAQSRLAYAGPMIVEFMSGALQIFDRVCEELNMDPSEADCDSLREYLLPMLKRRCESVIASLKSGASGRDTLGIRVEETVAQLEGRARSELLTYVDRKKLKIRNRVRQASPEMRERVAELISAINRHGNRALGFSLFQMTEPKALLDLARAPNTESDLVQSFQALGILLNQLNHTELKAVLDVPGKNAPVGSINRLTTFLQKRFGHVPVAALDALRDLGRLRSGYPAHPLRPDVEDAARRLGISLIRPEPGPTWNLVMQRLLEALAELSAFLETASPGKAKTTPP